MKIELKIIADIDIDQDEYPDITPETVLDSVRVYESDVVDGFEITTSIKGLDNTHDFFLQNAVLEEKKLIDEQELAEAPTISM